MTDTNKKRLATGALFLATIIWGISFVIMKNSLDYINPSYLVAIRFLFAAIIMSLIFIRRWKYCTLKLALTGIWTGTFLGLAYIIQTYGLKYTTPGKNAFLTSIYCIMVPFLMWVFTKKKPDKYNVIAVILTVIGIGFVSLNFTNGESIFGIGDILTIICSIFYGLHIVVVNVYAQKYDIYLITIFQFIISSAIAWIWSLIYEGTPQPITLNMLPQLLYLIIFSSAIALMLQNYGIKNANPNQGALILSLESVFGALASLIFGFETNLSLIKIMGFVIVFTAIVISETKLSFLRKKKTE